MVDDLNYDDLDPNIRETVRWLRGMNFDTCDSGDGVSKGLPPENCECDYLPFPHVVIRVTKQQLALDADTLARLLEAHHGIKLEPQTDEGGDEPNLQASYDPADGTAVLVLVNVHDAMLRLRN